MGERDILLHNLTWTKRALSFVFYFIIYIKKRWYCRLLKLQQVEGIEVKYIKSVLTKKTSRDLPTIFRFFLWVTKNKEQVTAAGPSLSLLLCREVWKSGVAVGAEQPVQWAASLCSVGTSVGLPQPCPEGKAHTHFLQEGPQGVCPALP